MTQEDQTEVIKYLMTNWPAKFSEYELSWWRRQIERMQVPFRAVMDALVSWRNSSKYPPKLKEIEDEIAKRAPRSAPPPQRKSVIANAVLRLRPDLADRTNAELHLIHHRSIWAARRRDVDESFRRAGQTVPQRQEDWLRERAEIIRRQCCVELIGFGLDTELADEIASSIIFERDDFAAALDRLGGIVREREIVA